MGAVCEGWVLCVRGACGAVCVRGARGAECEGLVVL